MADKHKVYFGLSKVHMAPVTDAHTREVPVWETPIPVPGAVHFAPERQQEKSQFFADNIAYFTKWVTSSIDGDLNMARFPNSVRTAIWGDIETEKGGLIEVDNADTKDFALLFQVETDTGSIRCAYYQANGGTPSRESNTLTDGGFEPDTETSALSCSSVKIGTVNGVDKYAFMYWVDESDPAYATWFDTVTMPTLPTNGG